MSDIILSVDGISKYFGGIHAIDDVSFNVERKMVTAVIGPNGAGKTTLFSVISGYHRPTRGNVRLEGNDITGIPPYKVAAAGAVRTFQLVRLFGKDDVARKRDGRRPSRDQRQSLERADKTGVVSHPGGQPSSRSRRISMDGGPRPSADMKASALTYGQQRRLEIARALAARPKLLLLDEPAAGLSTGETRELLSIIRSITDKGTSVMLIDHDMDLIMEIADKVVVLDFRQEDL